jgi:nucleoside-diphosphate-sugar epimerase
VGRQLVSQLVGAGAAVRALARAPDSAGLPGEVEVVRGDLSGDRAGAVAAQQFDHVADIGFVLDSSRRWRLLLSEEGVGHDATFALGAPSKPPWGRCSGGVVAVHVLELAALSYNANSPRQT